MIKISSNRIRVKVSAIIAIILICSSALIVFKVYPKNTITCSPRYIGEYDDFYQAQSAKVAEEYQKKSQSSNALIIVKEIGSDKLLSNINTPIEYDTCNNLMDYALNLYEPGSVIKPLVLTAAVNENNIDINVQYSVKSSEHINGIQIYNVSNFLSGNYTAKDIIASSLNTGAISILKSLGNNDLGLNTRGTWHRYLTSAYGLNDKSNLPIQNEKIGYIPSPYGLDNVEARYAQSSFGVGFLVTPVQLMHSYEKVLSETDDSLLSKTSKDQFKNVLVNNSIEYGNTTQDGYEIGGKTGTTFTFNEKGEYTKNEYGTYIGFVINKITSNSILIYCRLEGPNTKDEGASTQARQMCDSLTKQLIDNNNI